MHPILYSTPWFNIYSYGLMVAIGYTVSTAWTIWISKKEGLPPETIFDMLLLQMIAGIIGSRLLFMIESGTLFSGGISFLDFEKGGLVFYGGVISGLFFDLVFLRWKKIPILKAMDCVGSGFPLGIAFGRVGCLLNGCCYGIHCSLPWGVVFPKVSSTPLHPAQIYETLACLTIFLVLQKLWSRRRNYGQGVLMSLMLYASFRFFVEFWRGDNPAHALNLTLSQWVSIFALACGTIAWKIIDATPALRVFPVVSNPVVSPESD